MAWKLIASSACLVLSLVARVAPAQTPAATPASALAFEVVSIRPLEGDQPLFARLQIQPGGRVVSDATLRSVIFTAYGLQPYQRIEADRAASALLDRSFVIDARAPADPALHGRDTLLTMTRRLLADRFKLKIRMEPETRKVSVLRRIRPDKLGPNLRPFTGTCTASVRANGRPLDDPTYIAEARRGCGLNGYNGHLKGTVESMAFFAQVMSVGAERPILDDTGLVGRHQLEMKYEPSTLSPRARSNMGLPSFNDALRDDLGLRMDTEDRSIPVMLVEQVETPSEN